MNLTTKCSMSTISTSRNTSLKVAISSVHVASLLKSTNLIAGLDEDEGKEQDSSESEDDEDEEEEEEEEDSESEPEQVAKVNKPAAKVNKR